MARPAKKRRICQIPKITHFFVENGTALRDEIVLTYDEYETVRIIDFEGMSQEECAEHMNVARTTAQLIYNSARRKLAEALVYGQGIRIEGGNVTLCDGKASCVSCRKKEEKDCCSKEDVQQL